MATPSVRFARIAVPVVLALLVLAYIDGGYEDVRPISEEVTMPRDGSTNGVASGPTNGGGR